MKKFLLLVLVITAFAVAGCGSKNTAVSAAQYNKCYKDAPSWVIMGGAEGGLSAVGSAQIGNAGLSFARTEALANGRDEIARMLQLKVNNMVKNFTQTTGIGDAQTVDKVTANVSRQLSNQTLTGSKAKETYRNSAFVQNKMAKTLCEICAKHFGLNYGKIFEIGSGTGLLTDNIVKNFNFCEIILNDLTENFTGYNYSFLKGDASVLQLPKNCDLIISGACFQWICNVESFFTKLKKSLNEKGILAFSSFGKDNFYEFKSVENLGLDYCNYAEILSNCGYSIVEYERELLFSLPY